MHGYTHWVRTGQNARKQGFSRPVDAALPCGCGGAFQPEQRDGVREARRGYARCAKEKVFCDGTLRWKFLAVLANRIHLLQYIFPFSRVPLSRLKAIAELIQNQTQFAKKLCCIDCQR